MAQINNDIKLEQFDDVWGQFGDPAKVEEKFLELLPQAQQLENKSIYLQISSQLALSQALLKKYNKAHATLDKVEPQLTSEYDLARVRVLMERGRVFQQAGDLAQARSYFEQSYELSAECKFDNQTVNAAHMIAIVAEKVADKILWNKRSLDIVIASEDKKTHRWLGSVWNNLGVNYFEEKQIEQAYHAFEKALECRKHEKHAPNIRFAKFRVAQSLRLLGSVDKALGILQELLLEYESLAAGQKLDMPADVFTLTRGWIYEELIEIYHIALKGYANLAYKDLSTNEMFKATEPARLERLNKIKNW